MTDVSGEWRRRFGEATANAVQVYDEVMVPRLFAPWAEILLDAVAVQAGDDVLDVATGPGTVARLAAGRGARATGVDISPAMLAVARSRAGDDQAYAESAAAPLALPDRSFDVVVCQQGLQFFPDRLAALREMRRALRTGGRLGLAVWAPLEGDNLFLALADAVGEVLGDDACAAYTSGPWALGDAGAVVDLAVEAGFADVALRTEHRPLTYDEGADQLLATVAVTALAEQVTAADRQRLRAVLCRRLGPGPATGTTTAHIVTARR